MRMCRRIISRTRAPRTSLLLIVSLFPLSFFLSSAYDDGLTEQLRLISFPSDRDIFLEICRL